MKDFQLTRFGRGYWEMTVDGGDAEQVDGFETAVLTSNFSNARADESEIIDPLRRGGWVGNVLNPKGYVLGNKAWLMEREKVTDANAKTLREYVRRGYQWMIDKKRLRAVDVRVKPNHKEQKYEVFSVFYARDGRKHEYTYDWNVTDVNKITKNLGN